MSTNPFEPPKEVNAVRRRRFGLPAILVGALLGALVAMPLTSAGPGTPGNVILAKLLLVCAAGAILGGGFVAAVRYLFLARA